MEYIFTILEMREKDITLKDDESGKTLKWPRNKIPSDLKSGDKLFFYVSSKKSQAAKDILNEILQPEDN